MIVRKTMIGSVIGVGGPKQIRKPMSIYTTKVATEGRISFLIHSPVFVFRYRFHAAEHELLIFPAVGLLISQPAIPNLDPCILQKPA